MSLPITKQESLFSKWCTPEVNTFDQLDARTTAIRTIYDRDVKQISRIFAKQKRIGSPAGSPTDYSISIDDLRETCQTILKIIEDIELKLKGYRTRCSNVLFTVDRMSDRVYSYVQKGSASLGGTGVAVGLIFSQKNTGTCAAAGETPNKDETSPNIPIGWAGFALMCSAITISWIKDHVEQLKKEEKQFQDLIDVNHRMMAAHEASVVMLDTLQTSYDEAIRQQIDPNLHADKVSDAFHSHLNQTMANKGIEIPMHLQQACFPGAVRRAMLKRGQSRLNFPDSSVSIHRGYEGVSSPSLIGIHLQSAAFQPPPRAL